MRLDDKEFNPNLDRVITPYIHYKDQFGASYVLCSNSRREIVKPDGRVLRFEFDEAEGGEYMPTDRLFAPNERGRYREKWEEEVDK
jgi:hypothetical protein